MDSGPRKQVIWLFAAVNAEKITYIEVHRHKIRDKGIQSNWDMNIRNKIGLV